MQGEAIRRRYIKPEYLSYPIRNCLSGSTRHCPMPAVTQFLLYLVVPPFGVRLLGGNLLVTRTAAFMAQPQSTVTGVSLDSGVWTRVLAGNS